MQRVLLSMSLAGLCACVPSVGTAPTGGSAGTNDDVQPAPLASTCEAPVQVYDANAFTPCDAGASCLPESLIEEAAPGMSQRFAECPTIGTRCVPNEYFVTDGKFSLTSCTSLANAEGRCVSTVIPEVKEAALLLPSIGCNANEACAPCYDPSSGQPTGLCGLSCDAGPTQPAVVLASCEAGQGKCLSNTEIPAEFLELLDQLDCPNATDVCIPNQIFNSDLVQGCAGEIGFGVGPYYGVYVNTEIVDIDNSGFFDRNPANDDERCVPCFDPTDDNRAATGLPGCERTYPDGEPPLPND